MHIRHPFITLSCDPSTSRMEGVHARTGCIALHCCYATGTSWANLGGFVGQVTVVCMPEGCSTCFCARSDCRLVTGHSWKPSRRWQLNNRDGYGPSNLFNIVTVARAAFSFAKGGFVCLTQMDRRRQHENLKNLVWKHERLESRDVARISPVAVSAYNLPCCVAANRLLLVPHAVGEGLHAK